MISQAQIDRLNSLVRRVTPIAWEYTDRGVDARALMNMFCQTVPSGNQKIVTLQWGMVFPELKEWVDQRQRQKVFGEDLTVRTKRYEMTFDYNLDEIEDDDALIQLTQVSQALGTAAPSEVLFEALRPLRLNKVCYDGADFFSTSHLRLDRENETFSNLVEASWVGAKPTLDEARSSLDAAKIRLLTNRLSKRKIVEAASLNKDLLVVTSDLGVFEIFNRLLNDTELPGGVANDLKGTFRLFYDEAEYSGPEQLFDVYLGGAGDPRPVIFTLRKELKMAADTSKAFDTGMAAIGMDGRFGSTCGFPQAGVRVTPED